MGERLIPQFPPLRSPSPRLKSFVRPSPTHLRRSPAFHQLFPEQTKHPLLPRFKEASPSPSPKNDFCLDGRPVPVTHSRRTDCRVALEPLRVSDPILPRHSRRAISDLSAKALQWGKKRRKEHLTMVNISLPAVMEREEGQPIWSGQSFDSSLLPHGSKATSRLRPL